MSSSAEEKRENGSAMMASGWIMVLFALLVFFFHPAARKLGETRFAWVAGCLLMVGLLLNLYGVHVRRQNR